MGERGGRGREWGGREMWKERGGERREGEFGERNGTERWGER